MDYSKFQVEDFVADEDFIRWVKHPDERSNAFFNAWLSKHPASAERVRAAREVILHLDFKANVPPEGKFLEVWDRIAKAETVGQHPTHAAMRPAIASHKSTRKRWIYGMAALVALIVAALYVAIGPQRARHEISTAYGESRTVSLPDSTKVTLNSNSRISYSRLFASDGTAEVFLEGEAFFSVAHKTGNAKFIVRTNELNIEVLGTKFNVNSRRGNTKVILKEGKVRLNAKVGAEAKDVVMMPGEYIEYTHDKELKRKMVDADNYLEWRNNRLIFVSTSLGEIGQLLEDNYGYEVLFEDDSIRHREFTGSSSSVEIEELLDKLSRVYDLEVKKNGNKIAVKKNKEPPLESN